MWACSSMQTDPHRDQLFVIHRPTCHPSLPLASKQIPVVDRLPVIAAIQFGSIAQSYLTLWPHESQHARPPCPSPTPRVSSNSCPSSQWCHPAISSSDVPFSSFPQSLPAPGSFPLLLLMRDKFSVANKAYFVWYKYSYSISVMSAVCMVYPSVFVKI